MSSASDFVIEDGILKKCTRFSGDVTIPDGVTSIGDFAFRWCDSLTSATIPDSVTSIGKEAFKSCNSLTSITIPDSVTSIGEESFSFCRSLTSITIPDGVTSISNRAFDGCDSLTSITIPDGVTSIGKEAFDGCSSLTSITIPDGVTSIGAGAFSECSSLTSITIPDSVTSISDGAFYWCWSLTNVTIPNSVTSIGREAFAECSNLTSITIPDSVTSIGDGAFHGCSGLSDTAGFIIIRDVLYDYCGKGRDIVIPDGVTAIGFKAFFDCFRLTNITIPSNVTSIGDFAFYACDGLKSITIPAGLILKKPFKDDLPTRLRDKMRDLAPHLTDGDLKKLYLPQKVWKKQKIAAKAEVFINRQSKRLLSEYRDCMSDEDIAGIAAILTEKLTGKPSAEECTAAANLICLKPMPDELLYPLYSALKGSKAAAKAVKKLEEDEEIIDRFLGRVSEDDTGVCRYFRFLSNEQLTELIDYAARNRSTNVLAELLEYKNEHFPDTDPLSKLTLED